MIYLGDDKIGKLYLGSTEIGKAYLGSDLVFQKESPVPLPYDAEVEWLESTGTQYILTELYPNNTYTFDSAVAMTLSQNTVFWGVRKSGNYSTNNCQCYLNVNPGGNTFAQKLNLYSTASTNTTSNWSSGIVPTVGTMYDLTGMTVTSTMQAMTYPVTLFALNNIGSITPSVGACRIGYMKAYSSGVLQAHFKPVRLNGVGYMYEAVSGRLYGNAGSGDFTLGPDVV